MYFCLPACLHAYLSARPFVPPHGTNRLPLDGNLICQYFSKICWENSSFVKSWQEPSVHYAKTYLSQLSLKWDFFRQTLQRKLKHIFCSIIVFRKLWKILYSWTGYRWQYGACALHAGYLRLQTHTRICNNCCFYIAIMVARTCLGVIRTFSV